MADEKFSLPPLVHDSIQGRMDMIILRPDLVPSLLPNQGLEFMYSWWGNNFIHRVRLHPEHNEVKIIYNIHCDAKGLKRYLIDAKDLEVKVFVVLDQSSHLGHFSPSKYQIRRKKEWKVGDCIGKFVISNLKLNSRGEYMSECNICNDYGDNLGSIVVFMLFTAEEANCKTMPIKQIQPVEEKDKLSPSLSGFYMKKEGYEQHNMISPAKSKNLQAVRDNLSPRFIPFCIKDPIKEVKRSPLKKIINSPVKQKNVKEFKRSPIKKNINSPVKQKNDKEFKRSPIKKNINSPVKQQNDKEFKRSPIKKKINSPVRQQNDREVKRSPFKNIKSTIKQKNNSEIQKNPLKKIINSPIKQQNKKEVKRSPLKIITNSSEQKNDDSIMHLERTRMNKESSLLANHNNTSPGYDNGNFLLTKLFSFVDSGAIHPSDLPTLIQICQGRSPSMESCEFQDNKILQLSYSDENLSHTYEEAKNSYDNHYMTNHRSINKEKKMVQFSGVSYSSTSYPSTIPKTNRVFDEKFLHSLSSQSRDESGRASNKNENVRNAGFVAEIPDLDANEEERLNLEEKKFEEKSMIILRFYSINFNQDFFETQKETSMTSKQNRKIMVRQRSKICYFVEVYLEFESGGESQSALYVSRRIRENQEIIFDTSQIFRFPKTTENAQNSQGYLKFKISRRRLGNRLREEVGVGIISLDRLISEEVRERYVILPLWASNNGSEKHKLKMANGNMETPLGRLHFNVTFALTKPSSYIDYEALNTVPNAEKENTSPITELKDKVLSHPIFLSQNSSTECKQSPVDAILSSIDERCSNNTESLIIESGSEVNYIPNCKETDNESLEQAVHLEILEGNSLPSLKTKSSMQTFPPNSYVLTSVSLNTYKTEIVKHSSSPKWNYATNFTFVREDFKHTNCNLILKVFHSLNGYTSQSNDPLLGFAPIDISFLWNSFLSLCGWVPVLNLEGEICGEMKVSITSIRSGSSCKQHSNINGDIKYDPVLNKIEAIPQHVNLSELHITPQTNKENESVNRDSFEMLSPDHKNTTNRLLECRRKLFNMNSPDTGADKIYISNISSSKNEFIPCTDKLSDTTMLHSKKFPINEESENKEYDSIAISNINVPHQLNDDACSRSTTQHNNHQHTLPKNHTIEAMQWMNHLSSFDSPCVSYLDLDTIVMNKATDDKDKVPLTKRTTKIIKQKKCRIAANFDFFQNGK